ncbi:hypothetical protein SAY86_017090 [Trapa natans]|uniref:Uncharacterized protein n=1 Tax=Trapa natans TaxID=22666 RepID=A0AAN7M4N4_TRANT|nr:hypothetical protein SAY86_017090 [Trapa natans]
MGDKEDRREEFVEGFKLGGIMEVEGSEDESYLPAMEEEKDEDTSFSSCSIDSSDTGEEATSSSTSSLLKYSSSNSSSSGSLSNSHSQGPLYGLSELMAHLPIKRGLSKHYDGRSQSYTSLASVKSLEDLQKKDIVISTCSGGRKRLKLCKSYAGGLDNKSPISPKPVISKKGLNRALTLTSSSSSSSSSMGRRSFLASASRRPPVPLLRT